MDNSKLKKTIIIDFSNNFLVIITMMILKFNSGIEGFKPSSTQTTESGKANSPLTDHSDSPAPAANTEVNQTLTASYSQ